MGNHRLWLGWAEPREDATGAQAKIQRQCSRSTPTMHRDHEPGKYRVTSQVISTQNSDKLNSGKKGRLN